jgi:cell division transport system permease protein
MPQLASGQFSGGLMNRISNMLFFIIKESFITIKKAKGSFFISLITTSISIFLITLSWFLYDFSGAVEAQLKNNIILNVFISEELAENEITSFAEDIKSLDYISSVKFISKQEAADNFIKETGEDFRKVLDYNPLPASFKVRINEQFVTTEFLKIAVRELSELRGVDEVVYQSDSADKVIGFINQSKKYVLAAAVILILISVYIIYSTSKLILKARIDEMETMKLIGARISVIKLPVILNSLISGLVAGLISLLIFSLFNNNIQDYIRDQFSYRIEYFILFSVTIFTGPIIGVIISYLTLWKVTLKV